MIVQGRSGVLQSSEIQNLNKACRDRCECGATGKLDSL